MSATVTTHIDPQWLDAVSHRSFLNRVFPGQWDEASYRWYIARPFNGARSENVIRSEGERILSGMTLHDRQIRVDGHGPVDVSVISAAGTLSDERGRGHYERLLQAALGRARERSRVALLGFVTRGNGSGRGLSRLGAHAIPSFYIASPARRLVRHAVRRPFQRPATFGRVCEPVVPQVPQARFHYERKHEWQQQFIDRPNRVGTIRLSHDSVALVEPVGDTDRLQWLACPRHKTAANIATLASRSFSASRKFFMYTLDPHHAAAARRVGLRIRDGYLMLLKTGCSPGDWTRLVSATWHVQSGDRL